MKLRSTFWIIALLYFPQPLLAAENLNEHDYYDNWLSDGIAIKGEIQSLVINKDHSASFTRSFSDGSQQSFCLDKSGYEKIGDILILNFRTQEGLTEYKITLSGWKSVRTKAIYGTLYMYREGVQFNGVPVSFRTTIEINGTEIGDRLN